VEFPVVRPLLVVPTMDALPVPPPLFSLVGCSSVAMDSAVEDSDVLVNVVLFDAVAF